MKYIIIGTPIPLARPRFNGRKIYDSQKHKKLVAGINLRHQHDNKPLYEGDLHLDVKFYLKIASKKKISILEDTYHVYKPDLSNLLKFIEDVCTGIIYKDDSLICSVYAIKKYSSIPRTEFEIKVL